MRHQAADSRRGIAAMIHVPLAIGGGYLRYLANLINSSSPSVDVNKRTESGNRHWTIYTAASPCLSPSNLPKQRSTTPYGAHQTLLLPLLALLF
nr:hypothetical protein CFP56_50774 [Quercus suber]